MCLFISLSIVPDSIVETISSSNEHSTWDNISTLIFGSKNTICSSLGAVFSSSFFTYSKPWAVLYEINKWIWMITIDVDSGFCTSKEVDSIYLLNIQLICFGYPMTRSFSSSKSLKNVI